MKNVKNTGKAQNAARRDTSATWRHIFASLRPYAAHVGISVMLSAASVVLMLLIPIKIGSVIDLLLGKGEVDFDAVVPILFLILGMAAATGVATWISGILNNMVAYGITRDLRREVFGHIQTLPLSYIDRHPTGELVSRMIADADRFSDGLLLGFTQLFTGILTIIGTFVFMLTINVWITLAVAVLTPLSIFAAKFISSHTYSMFRRQSETRGEMTAFVEEMVAGQKTVKYFVREDKTLSEFDEINERLTECSVSAIFYSSLTNPATRFINAVVYAAVTLTGALFVIAGGVTPGMLTSLLSYANQFAKPFNEISGVITEFQGALASASRLYSLLDEPAEEKECKRVLADASGDVAFSHVRFSYSPERPLIRDVCIDVKRGQHIALVGPTGCGKTTLINLLLRFYDVTDGKITVDGEDIRELTRHSLRASYGMVLQDTWIKTGTVRENIKLGHPDATDEEMISAAKAAHADGFIRQLPHGYDTVLGEGGEVLSQGQRQLLSISRIMLSTPPILILDEATSSIDTRTEADISRAFTKMMAGRTAFIVAHRLSTIRGSDLILVMKDGDIIEQGTHSELLARGGFYCHLWESQFAGA